MFNKLFKSSGVSEESSIQWENLQTEADWQNALSQSEEGKVMIFKHSTRCPVSSSALGRLERTWQAEEMQAIKSYFLDLIAYRSISNKIAEDLGVVHQSPQVIVIEKGKAIYDNSHNGIRYEELKDLLA